MDTSLGGPLLPQDQTQEGRLPGTRGTHEEHELIAVDLDVDVVKRRTRPAFIYLRDVVEADHLLVAPLLRPEHGARVHGDMATVCADTPFSVRDTPSIDVACSGNDKV